MSEHLERPARLEGVVVAWDADRGFGFVQVPGKREQVFAHVKFLRHRHGRPAVGDTLNFAVTEGRNGRTAAADIEIVGARRRRRSPRRCPNRSASPLRPISRACSRP